jgi:putative oxidoreductase
MNTIHRVEVWADTHHPAWVDILRFALGIFLIIKGLIFAQNLDGLIGLINYTEAYAAGGIAHYIILSHVMGGLLIAIGLLTRVAVAFQIPVLLGAVVFAGVSSNYNYGELWQAIVVLALLVVFFIYGSGKWSVDEWMKRHPGQ